MKTYVIYHRADFDGIFCREIAKRYFEFTGIKVEYIGWDYGDPVPVLEPDAQLYMLDISIDQLMTWPGLVWIDHHKTAIAQYGAKAGLQLDGVAACRLAWRWFNHIEVAAAATLEDYRGRLVDEPLAVTLAGEYDIWDKRDPDAELFQHGLRSCEVDWQLLMEARCGTGVAYVVKLLEAGKVLQFSRLKENESVIKGQGFDLEFEGHLFLACNHARCNSLLFTAGLRPEHDGCLAFKWDGGKKKWGVSLYGRPGKPDIDFSAITVRYGGGGHKQACGFECLALPFTLGVGVPYGME